LQVIKLSGYQPIERSRERVGVHKNMRKMRSAGGSSLFPLFLHFVEHFAEQSLVFNRVEDEVLAPAILGGTQINAVCFGRTLVSNFAQPTPWLINLALRISWWEIPTMNTTVVREKRQVTIPAEVADAAGLRINDKLDWRFEDGEIRGRKLVPQPGPKRLVGKLVKRGNGLFLEIPKGYKLAPGAIEKAVREERDAR
jgi:bifunctional DNA-binding transcriptional regulator/antitoxin component of YhaV-PrlF toxin-antitoxin module